MHHPLSGLLADNIGFENAQASLSLSLFVVLIAFIFLERFIQNDLIIKLIELVEIEEVVENKKINIHEDS